MPRPKRVIRLTKGLRVAGKKMSGKVSGTSTPAGQGGSAHKDREKKDEEMIKDMERLAVAAVAKAEFQSGTVGSRLRDLRDEQKLTQADVAKHMGISRAAVAQWESDVTSISVEKIKEVAFFFRCTPEWLAFGVRQTDPAKAGTTLVPEMFSDSGSGHLRQRANWNLSTDWIRNTLRVLPDKAMLWTVEDTDMEPEFSPGDVVLIDRAATRATSGIFLINTPGGAVINRLTLVPQQGDHGTFRVRVSSSAEGSISYEVEMLDLKIIGRVKAKIQKI